MENNRWLSTCLLLLGFYGAMAQNSIGIGTQSPDASAILDVSSNTKGMLTPRMTTLQRQAIASPAAGLMVYDTDTQSLWYYNGTAWASLDGGSSGVWTSLNYGTYLTNLYGRVGIGTATPNRPLTIHLAAGPAMLLKSTDAGSWVSLDIDSDDNDAALRFYRKGVGQWNIRNEVGTDNFNIYELGSGGKRFTIENTTGNVAIGAIDPVNTLDVNGRMRLRHNGTTAGIWTSNSTNGTTNADGAFWGMFNDNNAGIYIGNAWRFQFSNNGNMTIVGTLIQNSDSSLKKDIHLLQNASTKIGAINGYNYHWIAPDRDAGLQTGLLAQEVEKVMPELVKTDEAGIKSVNYMGLIPYMLEAAKEQQAVITTQQKQIDELKKLVAELIKK